jgi:regulator of replication initiation timing
MSLRRFVRRVTGTEPDFWDFQVVDLSAWRHYVLFDGINPEGEQVYLQVGALERRGRGVWFLDIDPLPDGYSEPDAILLFVDNAFDWHSSLLPGSGSRYVLIGQVHFDMIEEGGILGGEKTTKRFMKRFRSEKGVQKILLCEVIPISIETQELIKWYEAARARIDFENLRKLYTKFLELRAQLDQLKAENKALIDENRMLKARVTVLFGELNRLKALYPELVTTEAISQIADQMKIQKIEEMKEEVYGKPSVWDLVLRRKTPAVAVKEEIDEFAKELEETEKKLKEVAEE